MADKNALLAPGTKVTYHGSLTEHHGEYTVIGPCGGLEHCERCDEAFDQVWDGWYWSLTRRDQARANDLFDRQFGHLFPRYELERKGGERLLCVRRSSITPATLPDGSPDMNGRADAETLAAQLAEAGCAVLIPDELIDGVWRLTITGAGSWTATVDVPAGGGLKKFVIDAADPEQAAKFAALARSLGCESA